MTAKDALKALSQAEKSLTHTRGSLASARAVVTTHEALCHELEATKQGEILKAGAAGKLPVLTEINHRLAAAREQLAESKIVVSTLEASEQEAIKALVQAEKQAQDALRDAWDAESDRARAELVRIAGPLLAAYFRARYHSNRPVALGNLLRSHGEELRQDLETSAEQTEVTFDVELPEVVESRLLTPQDRTAATRRAA